MLERKNVPDVIDLSLVLGLGGFQQCGERGDLFLLVGYALVELDDLLLGVSFLFTTLVK